MHRIMVTAWIVIGLAGCSSRLVTNTPRSAIEQLLLSGAVDRALEKFELPEIEGRKVFLDFANLKTYDVEYVKGASRARFARLGATLVEKREDAEYVAEVTSGGHGIEFKSSVIGLPPMPVPNAPVPTPELSAYRSLEQTGIVKLLILVHNNGKLVHVSRCYAKYDRDESFLFGYRFQRQDDVRKGWEAADEELEAGAGGE